MKGRVSRFKVMSLTDAAAARVKEIIASRSGTIPGLCLKRWQELMRIGGLIVDVRPLAKAGLDDSIFGKHPGHVKDAFFVGGKGGLCYDWG